MPSVSTPQRRRNVLTSVFRARSEERVADAGKAPRAPLPAAAFLPRFLLFPNPVSLSRVARLLRREPPGRVGGREVRLRLLGLGRHHRERNFLRFCWFLRSLRPLRVGNRRREIARRSRLVRAERVALDPRRGRRLRRRLGDPRLARHDDVDEAISRWTSVRGARECMLKLQAAGVIAGQLNDGRDLVEDPHLIARDFWAELEHPDVGLTRSPGNPIRFSETPVTFRKAAPELGQDNEAVLAEVGFSAAEIAELTAAGVVAHEPPERSGGARLAR